jgi:hypothetical protein
MAVEAVSSAAASASQALAAVANAVSAAVQEANESPAVTQREAASGDRQAIRLLAKQSQVDHLA